MTTETKIRTLAAADETLADLLGFPLFRWFDTQLPQGYIGQGTCVRVLRVSTARLYTHETHGAASVVNQALARFQFDVLDYDPEQTRRVAAAIRDWLATVDFSSTDQLDSPPVTPRRHPNAVLNQRHGMDYQLQPPVHVETLDVRIFDLEE